MAVDFENFESYYGGEDAETLRRYAEQNNDYPERKAMFLRLAELKEKGAIYTPSTEGGKLHYIRK
jgi:hypothetical protein